MLSSFIPESERIVTIEDAAELQLHQEHLITLESRPPNIEGKGAITIRDLVRNTLGCVGKDNCGRGAFWGSFRYVASYEYRP